MTYYCLYHRVPYVSTDMKHNLKFYTTAQEQIEEKQNYLSLDTLKSVAGCFIQAESEWKSVRFDQLVLHYCFIYLEKLVEHYCQDLFPF